MKIHEYQAKDVFAARGIAVPLGHVATTVEEAVAAVRPLIEESGNPVVVVKSQIHAGGRGKGRFTEHPDLGGVSVVTDGIDGGIEAAEARVGELAARMLGSTLVTIQTGTEGKQVNRLYIEQGIDIDRELYLSVVLDRATSRNIVMASTEGGTEIEEVAANTPERILTEQIDPAFGLLPFQARAIAYGLGLGDDALKNGVRFLQALATAAFDLDTDLVEVNPLVVTTDGSVMALDGKVSFDANALYRHPAITELRDPSEEDPAELEARNHGLSFIKLDGDIGCMVNGAGLAMATMDIIKTVGGEPANFLDVGGGADKDQIAAAFKIITADPNVKGIFVNIFGGIMRCDTIAKGVIEAVEGGRSRSSAGCAAGGHQRRSRQADPRRLRVSTSFRAEDMKDGAEKILELT